MSDRTVGSHSETVQRLYGSRRCRRDKRWTVSTMRR